MLEILAIVLSAVISLVTNFLKKKFGKSVENPKYIAVAIAIFCGAAFAIAKTQQLITPEVIAWWGIFSTSSVGVYEFAKDVLERKNRTG